jgi:hypothetical protein
MLVGAGAGAALPNSGGGGGASVLRCVEGVGGAAFTSALFVGAECRSSGAKSGGHLSDQIPILDGARATPYLRSYKNRAEPLSAGYAVRR